MGLTEASFQLQVGGAPLPWVWVGAAVSGEKEQQGMLVAGVLWDLSHAQVTVLSDTRSEL